MTDFKELKQQCYEANLLLPKLDLVIYTFGNVSCLDQDKGVYAIKPSGVDYDSMRWQDMVIVDLENNIVDGSLNPSSDTKTHTVLYNSFAKIGGIVHTHSTYATAWTQAKRDVPIYGTTHADHLATSIPCTLEMQDERIQNDYEIETGNQIVDTFASRGLNPVEVQMVLVASHGPFTWGANAEKAVYNSKVLEELSKMAMLTEQINAHPSSEPMKQALIAKHYNRKHGKDAYYGQ